MDVSRLKDPWEGELAWLLAFGTFVDTMLGYAKFVLSRSSFWFDRTYFMEHTRYETKWWEGLEKILKPLILIAKRIS